MKSAKTALGLTKYFVSLPPSRHLIALLLLLTILPGAAIGWLTAPHPDLWSALTGAGTALLTIALPALLCAALLTILRGRKVPLPRALALAVLTAALYLIFDSAAIFLSGFYPHAANLVFVGFGLSFLLWLVVLKFAFGLERSAWLFAPAQMICFAVFLLFGPLLLSAALPHAAPIATPLLSDLTSSLYKTALAAIVFVGALYALLFVASGPLKKNLGVSSPDVISMFASQWLYGGKDLEEAFDEMGEHVRTLVGVATFQTKQGKLRWVVPYIHFGPFGNLGGSQFSWQLATALSGPRTDAFVFHGTATHDFDPVSSDQLKPLLAACKKAIAASHPAPAQFSLSTGAAGDSRCHLLSINHSRMAAFTRAPLSTEDVNFAIGCQLMERAGDSLAIDCHNAETGDVDYIEAGSPIAFEMLDSLDDALAKSGKSSARLASKPMPLLAGWSTAYPSLPGLGSGGVKVCAFSGPDKSPAFYVLLDSNGIGEPARQRLISAIRRLPSARFVEILTTDTHQLNNVRGVFNPAGAQGLDELAGVVVSCAKEAHARLSPASFCLKKERFDIKVLGPYQSAEIVSTLNAVLSVLRILSPLVLLLAIGLVLWALSKV